MSSDRFLPRRRGWRVLHGGECDLVFPHIDAITCAAAAAAAAVRGVCFYTSLPFAAMPRLFSRTFCVFVVVVVVIVVVVAVVVVVIVVIVVFVAAAAAAAVRGVCFHSSGSRSRREPSPLG